MKRLAPHLRLATSARISNVWLLESQGERILVDTGHFLDRAFLAFDLWKAGIRKPGDLTAIVLTHRHSDHAANAAWLRKKFQCRVACHKADAPYLLGEKNAHKITGRNPAQFYHHSITYFEDFFPARAPVDDAFDEGPWRHGFRVIHTPGHTEGSVMLYHEPTRTLFSGDSIVAGLPPLRAFEYLSFAMPVYSDAIEACRDSVCEFLRNPPPINSICSGHGPYLSVDVPEKLKLLAKTGRNPPSWRTKWL